MDWAALLNMLGPLQGILTSSVFDKALVSEALAAEILDAAQFREERKPMKKELFTIYEVDNGFLGELTSGGLVIGATLSEACSAAQAQVATAELLKGDMEQPTGKTQWQKIPQT